MIRNRMKLIWWTTGMLLFIGFSFWLIPVPKSERTYSTALFDEQGNLVAASMTPDEQWCFPSKSKLPKKYVTSLLAYEDERYYYHPGIDVYAIGRALVQNIKSGSIKQGGSTVSMQVSRLIKPRKKRTVWVKLIEAVYTLRLEAAYSKEEIIHLYAHNAPFGSNIIGIEAACNRYFGTNPSHISWAQAALLAVLPNNPALIFPGRNKEKLSAKRNRLLQKLYSEKQFDESTLQLALAEPIPEEILSLPSYSNHLLTRVINDGRAGQQYTTTLDPILQQRATLILKRHGYYLKGNQIKNGAALILDTETGRCLAYVGNMPGDGKENGNAVDMIKAQRSYGSLLKPFLYASMLQEGMLLPNALVEDIPTSYDGYAPNNYFKEFEGVVPANEVLSRSLNVPSVRMLHQFGVQKFIYQLNKAGINSIQKPASHYGLSLILGGGEATLWELCGAYMNLLRASKNQYQSIVPYYTKQDSTGYDHAFSGLASAYTLKAISESKRIGADGDWVDFSNSQTVAWKTGTSFGARDAWSIGVSGRYTVGVWIGNADGEGRNGLTGIGMASPIMFDLFLLLPKTEWPEIPYAAEKIKICKFSGWKATNYCPEKMEQADPSKTGYAPACPYHTVVVLDST
jgi:penicillin-binding protein 1C